MLFLVADDLDRQRQRIAKNKLLKYGGMKEKLTYKGFNSPIKYEEEKAMYWGKIEGIPEDILFEAAHIKALKKAFQEAVEDYLFLSSATQGC